MNGMVINEKAVIEYVLDKPEGANFSHVIQSYWTKGLVNLKSLNDKNKWWLYLF